MWFWVVLLVVIVLLYIPLNSIVKQHNEALEQAGIIGAESIIYISGYEKIRPHDKFEFYAYSNRLELYNVETSQIKLNIPYEDLISIDVKTESEIKSSVTLSRLLMLGALAFFAKKEEENFDKYIIISFNENEKTHDMLLQQNIMDISKKSEREEAKLEQFAIKIRQAKWDYENKDKDAMQIKEQ